MKYTGFLVSYKDVLVNFVSDRVTAVPFSGSFYEMLRTSYLLLRKDYQNVYNEIFNILEEGVFYKYTTDFKYFVYFVSNRLFPTEIYPLYIGRRLPEIITKLTELSKKYEYPDLIRILITVRIDESIELISFDVAISHEKLKTEHYKSDFNINVVKRIDDINIDESLLQSIYVSDNLAKNILKFKYFKDLKDLDIEDYLKLRR